MAVVYYPAIIEAGPGPGYGVFFPDLPGCVSAGDTLQEAARNAEIALQLHLTGMTEDGLEIPAASELDDIPRDPSIAEAARAIVRGELPNRLERVNITMDEGLLKVIDFVAEARGMTRSGFLAESARQLVTRVRESAGVELPKTRRRSAGTELSAFRAPAMQPVQASAFTPRSRSMRRDVDTGRLEEDHPRKAARRAPRRKK